MELPSIVHTVKPINAVQVVELPTCMYQMPNLSLSFESTTPTVSELFTQLLFINDKLHSIYNIQGEYLNLTN